MWIAVIPALNEEKNIAKVINTIISCNIDCIVLVANGCQDYTSEIAMCSSTGKPLHILIFKQPLGIDVPRAIGASFVTRHLCLDDNFTGVIFIDGDMRGDIRYTLLSLMSGIEQGLDMSLTNCYPYIQCRSDLAANVLKERELLNRRLGLFNDLGLASPSHGPHAISADLCRSIPARFFAVPPLSLAYAAKNSFLVGVSATVSHSMLGSPPRTIQHANLIAQTIIEDCRHALVYLNEQNFEQLFFAHNEQSGYRPQRRYPMIERFLFDLENKSYLYYESPLIPVYQYLFFS